MWTVVYMSQNKDVAMEMGKVLQQEGILVKLREATKRRADADSYYEVLVPEAEIEEAHAVIVEKGY